MSKILDGKKLSDQLIPKLKKQVNKLKIKPKLVIIQIGNLEESNIYIKKKKIFAHKKGGFFFFKKQVNKLKIKPKLVIIQIGNLEESNIYIKKKKIFAHKIGVLVLHKKYSN